MFLIESAFKGGRRVADVRSIEPRAPSQSSGSDAARENNRPSLHRARGLLREQGIGESAIVEIPRARDDGGGTCGCEEADQEHRT